MASSIVVQIRVWLARMVGGDERTRGRKELAAKQGAVKQSVTAHKDRIEDLKQRMSALESKALRLSQERNQTKGAAKRVIEQEIVETFRRLDLMRHEEAILRGVAANNSAVEAQLNAQAAGVVGGVTEDMADEVALASEEMVAELKATDRAVSSMEKVQYERPEDAGRIDLESKLSELEGAPCAETQSLPPDIEKRLRELESE